VSTHRHRTPLRGVTVVPRPAADNPDYTPLNYAYAGQTGHVHEVVTIGGRELVKVGFADRKIVYYLLADLEMDESAKRGTFHDEAP
jgi:hypothetical protein